VRSPSIINLDTSDWHQVAVSYDPGKLPILAECNRDDGTGSSLAREGVEEFLELLEELPQSDAKKRVLRHLKATRFIVGCQLATSDIDDRGYNANDQFLAFFAERCGGMIQADGEGFYEGADLVLPLA
jgi:hypothetical protein